MEPYDPPTTVLVQRSEPQGVSTVLSSTDFFQSKRNRRLILEQVDSFQLRDKYLFATTTRVRGPGAGPEEPSHVAPCIPPGHRRRRRASFLASVSCAETRRRSVNVCPARLPRLDRALAAAEAVGEQTGEQMANTVWLLVLAAANDEEPERSAPSFKRAETSARSTVAFG